MKLRDALDKLEALVDDLAHLEVVTTVDHPSGRAVGLATRVSPDLDAVTFMADDLPAALVPALREAHEAALASALASRRAYVRLFSDLVFP